MSTHSLPPSQLMWLELLLCLLDSKPRFPAEQMMRNKILSRCSDPRPSFIQREAKKNRGDFLSIYSSRTRPWCPWLGVKIYGCVCGLTRWPLRVPHTFEITQPCQCMVLTGRHVYMLNKEMKKAHLTIRSDWTSSLHERNIVSDSIKKSTYCYRKFDFVAHAVSDICSKLSCLVFRFPSFSYLPHAGHHASVRWECSFLLMNTIMFLLWMWLNVVMTLTLTLIYILRRQTVVQIKMFQKGIGWRRFKVSASLLFCSSHLI